MNTPTPASSGLVGKIAVRVLFGELHAVLKGNKHLHGEKNKKIKIIIFFLLLFSFSHLELTKIAKVVGQETRQVRSNHVEIFKGMERLANALGCVVGVEDGSRNAKSAQVFEGANAVEECGSGVKLKGYIALIAI